EDERRIEAWRAYDRRDAHPLGRHDHELDVAQVEAGVLHVDEGGIVAGVPDDLDDLGIGDPARVGAQRETARTQDFLHSIGLHGYSSLVCARSRIQRAGSASASTGAGLPVWR